eukprot:TRINITY_DN17921_c0_g1_i1.p1 TRINITY_DN17921_c0_g1~~TRINITY_DN17921_c0_g1_i1.p1  ORF type:complete len:327 (+),score=47.19 TRINITY_DN17921_c0_g1_i1:188-1168(+)
MAVVAGQRHGVDAAKSTIWWLLMALFWGSAVVDAIVRRTPAAPSTSTRWSGASASASASASAGANATSVSGDAVHVVLCHGNQSDPHLSFMSSVLRTHGFTVHMPDCSGVYREGFVSNVTGNWYQRWGRRWVAYGKAVASLPTNATVMLLDVNDVLVMGSASEALHRFRALGAPLVASCTEAQWPPPQDCPAYETILTRFSATTTCRFPCAGALMGSAWALLDVIGEGFADDRFSDQCRLHERLASLADERWKLDVEGDLFLDVNRVPQGQLHAEDGRFEVHTGRGLRAGLRPTILHAPGLHPKTANIEELYAIARRSSERSMHAR